MNSIDDPSIDTLSRYQTNATVLARDVAREQFFRRYKEPPEDSKMMCNVVDRIKRNDSCKHEKLESLSKKGISTQPSSNKRRRLHWNKIEAHSHWN